MLAETTPTSQVAWLKAGVLGDLDKHTGAYLHALMESKDIVRVSLMFKRLV
ncbi:hypothetical protein FB106_10778 [Synechococcus sp. Ace-Pa]|nr:hypothetical protein FB106_10778 [Synechococcus sp. Ace-Pa]